MIVGVVAGQTLPAAGGITCAFPLSSAGLGAFGIQPVTLSGGDQTLTATLAAGTNNYGAGSFTQPVPADTGAPVMRLAIGALPLMAADGSEGIAAIKIAFFGAGPAEKCGVIIFATNGGAYSWTSTGVGGAAQSYAALASLPDFVDVRFRETETPGAGMMDIALSTGELLDSVPYDRAALNALVTLNGLSVSGAAVGHVLSASLVTDAASFTNSPFAGRGGNDVCGTAIGDPRIADVTMMLSFIGKDGQTTVTDTINGDVYTLHGTASISGGQMLLDGAGYADAPDSPAHDTGLAPDVVQLIGVEFYTVTAGFQCLASNFDGTHTCLTVQRTASDILLTTAGATTYTWTNVPGGPGFVAGAHYDLEFERYSDGSLYLRCNGVRHPTVYTGVTEDISGSVNNFTIGRLPVASGYDRYFEGRVGGLRTTNGAPRSSNSARVPVTISFPIAA